MNREHLKSGVKIASELLITPGSSLLIEGDLKRGAIHVGVGLCACALLGLPGIALVAASSYFKSLGKGAARPEVVDDPKRDPAITRKVQLAVEQGLGLDEVRDCIVEDVEDAYHEIVTAGAAHDSGAAN